jgi:hypothetical protein
MPPTRLVPRATLVAMVMGTARIEDVFEGCCFPIILRPVGSRPGATWTASSQPTTSPAVRGSATAFYLSHFVDYSGADGRFRKFRVALIDGQPFCLPHGHLKPLDDPLPERRDV